MIEINGRSITHDLDERIEHWKHQGRGWFDVGHDYNKSKACYRLARILERKREVILKNIFGV
jgi:hypothetical protein